ncbi:hypothetical protein P153DRAFT_380892 [Dothidotthia symphoricarpi CBS 119687]|uniref:DNA-directed RNA polymerase III subunit RPC9 n=1 Tax=Dothidotthia symphoricarpi CBS 119687 TaxID=1392245 RepID=A0A6A6ART6_9PLEO|nr:uncharacterized protein P153DRAFT_380892 [Dothidotthia symphoricarpi CBS 119687]KAF2133705.1 hypothetical protein P153DRAFT_380892 [Dothidotthia symphoricarpi CBS 119687]
MHIKTPQSALLSNHELHLHLLAESTLYHPSTSSNSKPTPAPPGLTHTLRDGLAYLSHPSPFSPPSSANLTTTHPNRPKTLYKGPHSLFRALAPKYRLNKAEYLQIYNLRPRTALVLELVVEEASTRFSDAEMADILSISQRVFDEEEGGIPEGVEDVQMERVGNKLLGAGGGRRKGRAKNGRK